MYSGCENQGVTILGIFCDPSKPITDNTNTSLLLLASLDTL